MSYLICVFFNFCHQAEIEALLVEQGAWALVPTFEKRLKVRTLEFKSQFAVTLGKFFNLSQLGFLHLKNVDDNSVCSARLFCVRMS